MVEERFGNIEKRLERVEDGQKKSEEGVKELRVEIDKVNHKLSEEFKIILENDRKSMSLAEGMENQNREILKYVLEGKEREEERLHELKLLKWNEIFKVIGLLFGTGGVVYLIVQSLI